MFTDITEPGATSRLIRPVLTGVAAAAVAGSKGCVSVAVPPKMKRPPRLLLPTSTNWPRRLATSAAMSWREAAERVPLPPCTASSRARWTISRAWPSARSVVLSHVSESSMLRLHESVALWSRRRPRPIAMPTGSSDGVRMRLPVETWRCDSARLR